MQNIWHGNITNSFDDIQSDELYLNKHLDLDFPPPTGDADNEQNIANIELKAAELDENGNICKINFAPFLSELFSRDIKSIYTVRLKKFMRTLKGKARPGIENGIRRLQYFLNAYQGEESLVKANEAIISYFSNADEHRYLKIGGTGSNDPDLRFKPSNGKEFSLEVKINFSDKEYYEGISNTNFHNADYAIVFIIQDKRWKLSRKVDGYSVLADAVAFEETDPWLQEIIYSNKLRLISFNISDSTPDSNVPANVQYKVIDNIVKNKTIALPKANTIKTKIPK